MQRSILSLLQDEMVALANAELAQRRAEDAERRATYTSTPEEHRRAAAAYRHEQRVQYTLAERARAQAKLALMGDAP